jgi:hypothetical protein
MDKLQPTGQNLGRVFNLRFDHLHAEHFWCYQIKLPNLNSKTRHKLLLGSLPLVIALPGKSVFESYSQTHLQIERTVYTSEFAVQFYSLTQIRPD